MISGAYLRRQAEILTAMSRATFDLTIAARLRRMAAELQDKASEEDDASPLSPHSRIAALPAAGADVPLGSADRRYLLQAIGLVGRALFKACPSLPFAP
jgi:hypothetical protein